MINELYANFGYVVTQEANGFAVFRVRGTGDAQEISLLHWFGPNQKSEAIEAGVKLARDVLEHIAYLDPREALERARKGEDEFAFPELEPGF
jgi:hypothetical protein